MARMPDAAPRWLAGTLFMIAGVFGRGEQARADAVEDDQHGERR